MDKPDISDNFTVEDIHKIREYNADRRKKLNQEKRLKDIKENANKCERDIDKYRNKKVAI